MNMNSYAPLRNDLTAQVEANMALTDKDMRQSMMNFPKLVSWHRVPGATLCVVDTIRPHSEQKSRLKRSTVPCPPRCRSLPGFGPSLCVYFSIVSLHAVFAADFYFVEIAAHLVSSVLNLADKFSGMAIRFVLHVADQTFSHPRPMPAHR